MTSSGAPAMSSSTGRILASTALLAAILGASIAGYLVFENLQDETGVCVGVHGCATVQQSKYGDLLGVPVSVPGLLAYVALVGAAIVWLMNFRDLRAHASLFGFLVAFASVLFSGYLTSIEAFVLDAWCAYCIVSALLTVVLFGAWTLLLRQAWVAETQARAEAAGSRVSPR